MNSSIDQELEAIKALISALEPLEAKGRERVLNYAIKHLELEHIFGGTLKTSHGQEEHSPLPATENKPVGLTSKIVDIRSLREQKKPATDVEMAAIVAYYLSELAPNQIRQDRINSKDLKEYFKQAGHPLPKEPRFTLANARTAGYLENLGGGNYKLNPVGHNLVVHTLPRAEEERKAPATKKPRRGRAKQKKAE